MKTPRVILWDIETSLMVVSKFDLYPDYIQPENIIDDWYIICASWMELGDKRPCGIAINQDKKRFKKNPKDDYIVVKKLREVLVGADLIVAHNGEKFDLPKLNARLIYHGLDPLPPIRILDTKKEAKKIAKFSSNKLDYFGSFFGLGRKIHTDAQLWRDCLNHDERAINKMLVYNKQDTLLLKRIYLRMRKYFRRHPNLFMSHSLVCPVCGSSHLEWAGYRLTIVMRYRRFRCLDCGSWGQERTPYGERPTTSSI